MLFLALGRVVSHHRVVTPAPLAMFSSEVKNRQSQRPGKRDEYAVKGIAMDDRQRGRRARQIRAARFSDR